MRQHADAFAATWTALASVVGTECPAEQTVSVFRDPTMLAAWPLTDDAAGLGGERTRSGIDALQASSETMQDIDDDHFRLLRGPGIPAAVPWESVHLGEEQLLFDEETFDVRRMYQRFGLQAPKLNVEPDDHVSLELEFLSQLLVRGMQAEDKGDASADEYFTAHDEFCRDHVLRWVPTFFEQLTDAAETSFYRGIGLLGQDALAAAKRLVVAE